jgi:hypothetical protein
MALSRRSFFTKLAGAALGARIAPFVSASLLGPNVAAVGGFVHFGHGTLAMSHGPEYIIPLVRASNELLDASSVNVAELMARFGVSEEWG